ncbi:HPP family protein [Candidatus Marsarchaeota archaeon]|nr:HPP family protein [Candidatus Marsarchaeota archaeon]MCL5404502.1 HPP family protein [Candidatus Marsarchaeota archaeon]
MALDYRMKEPRSFKEALRRLKYRVVPSIFAGVALGVLVFMLKYFEIDKAYGLGTSAVIFTSFASSIYIMFIMPNSRASHNSKFVKSYVIAGIVGTLGGLGLAYVPLYAIAAIVMFTVSVLMIVTKSEHPPAAAIAFAFVLFHVGIIGIIIIASGVALVVLLRFVLEKSMFEIEREVRRVEERERLKSETAKKQKKRRG